MNVQNKGGILLMKLSLKTKDIKQQDLHIFVSISIQKYKNCGQHDLHI